MKSLFFAMALLLPLSASAAECRAVNIQEFREATVNGPQRLVFFASWCASCSRFITKDRIQDTIFVAAADEKAKAEKVLDTYLKDRAAAATCFFDKDESVAKAYGVRNLPLEKLLHDSPKP